MLKKGLPSLRLRVPPTLRCANWVTVKAKVSTRSASASRSINQRHLLPSPLLGS